MGFKGWESQKPGRPLPRISGWALGALWHSLSPSQSVQSPSQASCSHRMWTVWLAGCNLYHIPSGHSPGLGLRRAGPQK